MTIDTLRNVPLFESLDDEAARKLCQLLESIELPALGGGKAAPDVPRRDGEGPRGGTELAHLAGHALIARSFSPSHRALALALFRFSGRRSLLTALPITPTLLTASRFAIVAGPIPPAGPSPPPTPVLMTRSMVLPL